MRLFLFADGASKGNPGPAAAGVVIKDEKGKVLAKRGILLGEMTNNEAEYRALLWGLALAKEIAEDGAITCFLDSKLVVSQLKGLYKIKAAHLGELVKKVWRAERSFSEVAYRHIPREKNADADALANRVLNGVS